MATQFCRAMRAAGGECASHSRRSTAPSCSPRCIVPVLRHSSSSPRAAAASAAATTTRRRDSRAAAASASPPPPQQQPKSARPPTEIVRISPELLAAGGLDPATEREQNLASFAGMLAAAFLPVDLSFPGVRILNVDPPVLSIDNFASDDTCDALTAAAAASGRLARSRVGGGGDAATRTSSTLALTADSLAACPALRAPLDALLDAAGRLLAPALPPGQADFRGNDKQLFAKPTPGRLSPELPQVARYEPGQLFSAHEDGFPPSAALQKGYQRRATLLVYLNDVARGGETRFEHLGFGVAPRRGRALLFFPAFGGGMPDARTLHTAEEAVDEKWVSQMWLCTALPKPQRPPLGSAPPLPPRGKNRGFR